MMLTILRFLLLGIIQGFTEPIPVSSSGHLLIFQKLIQGNSDIDYNLLSILTNFGSFLAIFFIFRKEIFQLFKSFFGYLKTKEKKYYNDYKYCWLIVLGTIPAGIMGLVVTKLDLFAFLEENVKFIGVTLLITAVFLFLIRNIKGNKEKDTITWKDALVVGLFQVVALIPGISRSGSTIVGGMSRKFTRETAFNFSFLLYMPISIATLLLGVKDLIEMKPSMETLLYYGISMIAAMVVTYFSAQWFKDIMKKGKLIYFVIYCAIVGSLVILFL